ncbi:hypothetical protein [Lentzea sp. NEAU-D7]|uniref:hypothetical protein n=1 Tax=Lentzea sp. NEAU-D7 TaxID=2994667 RepID=UPI00224B7E88|nr:hypothetical protein [Lentzea sp. NEAU-D7]MCX2953807.1 hypothetical protein [Lentzea sp. NEAU-D7]
MTGARGQAAAGVVLLAWIVVFAALTEVENPQVLLATAVSGGLVCLCAVAGGVVAVRVTDAEAAARLRHVFVVLEGTAMAIFYLFYGFAFSVEPVGRPGEFAVVVLLVLSVPALGALVLVLSRSYAVHKLVVNAYGPLVPDSGEGVRLQRIRVLGTVLVTVGLALAVSAMTVALVAPLYRPVLLVVGLLVTLTPVVLGMSLARVTDVHSARRRNVGNYVIVLAASGFAVSEFSSGAGVAGALFGALVFGAVVLLVIAILVVREFTGEWDRPWRGRRVSR